VRLLMEMEATCYGMGVGGTKKRTAPDARLAVLRCPANEAFAIINMRDTLPIARTKKTFALLEKIHKIRKSKRLLPLKQPPSCLKSPSRS